MAEPMMASLELDTSDAQARIQELGSMVDEQLASAGGALTTSLEEALSGFTLDPVELAVEADTSGVTDEIDAAVADAEAMVPVDADTAPVEAALASIDDNVEPIEVVVDTADAQAQVDGLLARIEELEAAATGAGGGLDGLTGSVDGMNAAAGLATGSAAGLGAGLETLGDRMTGPVAAGAALAGVVAVFANEAIEAQGATQRFEATLGELAARVENLRDIDGLDTDLSQLALTLGSDDDKIRNVIARLFELAEASGVAGDDAAVFVQQMTALGARAVAINPQLGDVGDVTDALSTALVRGGRFAAKYGLDLNQAAINARALAMTGKSTADELTYVEKAMAGAAIATEKYGGNLEQIVARGSENAITKQRQFTQAIRETVEELGMPLVAPIFEIMERGQPIVEAIGSAFLILGQGAIPVVGAALDGVQPVLDVVLAVLQALPPELVAGGAAWLAFGNPIAALLPILAAIDPDLVKILATVGAVVGVVYAAAKAWQVLRVSMAANPIGAVLVGVTAVVSALGLFGGAAENAGDKVKAMAGTSETAIRKLVSSIAQVPGSVGEAFRDDLLKTWRQSLEDDIGTAEKLGRVLVEQGVLSQREYSSALRDSIASQREASATRERGTALVESEAKKLEEATKAREAAQAAIDKYVDSATSKLPTVSGIFDKAAQDLRAFFNAPVEVDPGAMNARLEEQIANIQAFQGRVQALLAAGLVNIADLVIQQGPDQGSAFAEKVLGSEAEVQATLERNLGAYRTGVGNLTTYLQTEAGPQITTAFGQGQAGVSQATADAWAAVGFVIDGAVPGIAGSAGAAGTGATTAYGAGIAPLPGASSIAMSGAAGAVQSGAPAVQGAAGAAGSGAATQYGTRIKEVDGITRSVIQALRGTIDSEGVSAREVAGNVGRKIGRSLGEGIEQGIGEKVGQIAAEAARAVRNAEEAARAEARSHSPSELFAEVGSDLMAGLALGVDETAERPASAAERAIQELTRRAKEATEQGNQELTAALNQQAQTASASYQRIIENNALGINVNEGTGGNLYDALPDGFVSPPVGVRSSALWTQAMVDAYEAGQQLPAVAAPSPSAPSTPRTTGLSVEEAAMWRDVLGRLDSQVEQQRALAAKFDPLSFPVPVDVVRAVKGEPTIGSITVQVDVTMAPGSDAAAVRRAAEEGANAALDAMLPTGLTTRQTTAVIRAGAV